MTAPHETPQFRNAAEYTVTITFRVEGGARWQTADRRARKIAERLTNHAARAAQVVEVSAVGGPSQDGKPFAPERIRFSAANSGAGSYGEPTKLGRYLDPEFERALASLAEVNAAARAVTEADQQRRQAIGCLNTYQSSSSSLPAARCLCVYCAPGEHEHALRRAEAGQPDPLRSVRCICGRAVAAAGLRCARHIGVQLVVLDGDSERLRRLAQRQRPAEPPDPRRGVDGPELPPPGL